MIASTNPHQCSTTENGFVFSAQYMPEYDLVKSLLHDDRYQSITWRLCESPSARIEYLVASLDTLTRENQSWIDLIAQRSKSWVPCV